MSERPATPGIRHRVGPRACSVAKTFRRAVLALLVLLGAAGANGAEWPEERRFGPMIVRAEFPLADYDGLLRELVELNRELQRVLALPAAREPVEIYLFRDDHAYSQQLRRHVPNPPDRRALYLKQKGPGQVLAFRSKELAVDLRHECTHAFLHAALPAVPLWLDEGLAEYFEAPPGARANDSSQWNLLFKADLQLSRVPRLADLESRQPPGDLSATDYQHAWSWAHFLLHGPPEAHEELVRYVADISAGQTPGRLGPRLEQRVPQLERAYLLHFRSWKWHR